MKVHEIKASSEYYWPLQEGLKTFEIRYNDRDYKVGDILVINKIPNFIGEEEEPRSLKYQVTYVLNDQDFLQPGFVCLGIYRLKNV